MQSLNDVTRHMSVLNRVNYCALHMLLRSLLYALQDKHEGLDFLDFVSDTLYTDISASHWMHDHYAPIRRSRSTDNEG